MVLMTGKKRRSRSSGRFPKRENDSCVAPANISLGYSTPGEATGPRSHELVHKHISQPGKKDPIHLFEQWLPGSSSHSPPRMGMRSFGKRYDPIADEPLRSRTNLVSSIIICSTVPAGQDPYGRVSSGKLDIEGLKYEVKPQTPNKRWDRHSFPVEIDLEDGRGISAGSLHLDVPEEPISYPCYALFLGPPKALILRSNKLEARRNEDGTKEPNTLVSKSVLTTLDVNRNITEHLETKDFVFQALRQGVRIGVGVFLKEPRKNKHQPENEEEKEPEIWDGAKQGKLTLDKILHVEGDQSWGPVTKDDRQIWIAIV
ncbi:hypothetical protein F4814DRAFT_458022 [Daldinia grandis]|nr:hypothetical protein F4814DRAFT_458022 [Daldinia grandis]